jgi:Ca2+-binding EF-hand superfamily protein
VTATPLPAPPPPPPQAPTQTNLRPKHGRTRKPGRGLFSWVSAFRSFFGFRQSSKVHPHLSTAAPLAPASLYQSKYQSERLDDAMAAGRSQLDILAKHRFGVGQRWTAAPANGSRANGSVREDDYDDTLKRSVAHAQGLAQLSIEELEIAMKTFRRFDRDGDGKLLPDEMLAFWKHITLLTVADHAGSMREAGENADACLDSFDQGAIAGSVEGGGEGGMDLPEFIRVLQRFSAAEQALVGRGAAANDDDVEYRVLLSQAACSLVVCDAISGLPGDELVRAVDLFKKADVKRRGSLRMTVAAARLGLPRASVGGGCDLDKNQVLDFNEFVKCLLPRMSRGSEARPSGGRAGASAQGRWGVAGRWKTGEYASVSSVDESGEADAAADAAAHHGAILGRIGGSLEGGPFAGLGANNLEAALRLFKKFDRDGDGILKPEEMSEFWLHVTNLTARDHIGTGGEASECDFGPGHGDALLAQLDGSKAEGEDSTRGMNLNAFITVLERFSSAEGALLCRLDASRDDEYEYRTGLVQKASSLCLFDAVSPLSSDDLERAVDAFKLADTSKRGSLRRATAGELLGVSTRPGDDADANGVLDFNEFARFVMPRIDAKLRDMNLGGASAAQQAREVRAAAKRTQSSRRFASARAEEAGDEDQA